MTNITQSVDNASHIMGEYQTACDASGDPEARLVSLLVDLMHYAKHYDIRMDRIIRYATTQYNLETAE